jgi:hypothetical protein
MSLPSYIAADLVAEAQNVIVTLEGVFKAHPVDSVKSLAFTMPVATAPAVSSTTPAVTSPIMGLYAGFVALCNAIPMLISDLTGVDPSLPLGLLALARGLGSAMAPADAVAAFAMATDAVADPMAPLTSWTANRIIDNANAALIARITRTVYLAPYIEGLVTQTYGTREDAITARADCVGRFERELDLCAFGDDLDFAIGLTAMRDAVVNYLSLIIVNAKPVLSVTTPVNIPALVAAWRIYADPTMAADLIARNDVKTIEFMPTTFEALAA